MAMKSTVKIKVDYLGSEFIFEFKKEREKDRIIRYKQFEKELATLEDKSQSERLYRDFCFTTLIGVSGSGAVDENGSVLTAQDIVDGNCYPEVLRAASEAYMYILRGAEAEAKKELILD